MEKTRREDLTRLLAEMRAENGPATREEDTWARSALGLSSAGSGATAEAAER